MPLDRRLRESLAKPRHQVQARLDVVADEISIDPTLGGFERLAVEKAGSAHVHVDGAALDVEKEPVESA